MPEFAPSLTGNADLSSLTPGWHPAYLCGINEEPIPDGWAMADKGAKLMYRWHFAVWPTPDTLATQAPEHQTGVSSRTFSPGGKNPASKAFVWTTELLGRRPQPGERINLDPLMPLPCRLKIARDRNDGTPIDYARIADLEAWPEGVALCGPELKAALQALGATWLEQSQGPIAPPAPPSTPPPVQQASAPTHPGLAAWGNSAGQRTAPPAKPVW